MVSAMSADETTRKAAGRILAWYEAMGVDAALQAHPLTAGARLALNPSDASAAGIADGAMARVAVADGHATLPASLDPRVAPGCAWVESGYGVTAPLVAAGRVQVGPA